MRQAVAPLVRSCVGMKATIVASNSTPLRQRGRVSSLGDNREVTTEMKRYWGILTAVLAVVAVLATQLPATAHHKEGHNNGKPESAGKPQPSPTPSPTPGNESARPCANASYTTSAAQVTCNAVSDDGSIDITGWMATETRYWVCSDPLHGCLYDWNDPPMLSVKVMVGSVTVFDCRSPYRTEKPIRYCMKPVSVPSGTPVTCLVETDNGNWQEPTGPRKTLLGVACS